MGIDNAHKLIVNCLPLTSDERAAFTRAARNVPQEFVGDEARRGDMSWKAVVSDDLKASATAIVGNIPVETCADYPRLEWLQTWSAGVDAYRRAGITRRGIMLTNASGAYGQSVSEHMFAMMWSLMRNIPQYARNQMKDAWIDEGIALSPSGKTALIIGTGDIGSHFATLCKAVGMTTFGIRRNASKPADGIDDMHGFDDLDMLLPKADVVAMCVPSAPETHNMLDSRRIMMLKNDAVVINAGRGDAIDLGALCAALREGRLHGAGLDVTDPEPLPSGHPLWNEPRCLITPHVAGGNHIAQTPERIIGIALANVRAYAAGQQLMNLVG